MVLISRYFFDGTWILFDDVILYIISERIGILVMKLIF